MSSRLICAARMAAFATLFACSGLAAQDAYGRGGLELGGFAGIFLPGEPEFDDSEAPFSLSNDLIYGGRLGYAFGFPIFIEADVAKSAVSTDATGDADLDFLHFGGGLGINFQLAQAAQLFVRGGAGAFRWEEDADGTHETDLNYNVGAGLRLFIGPAIAIRLEARDYILPDGLAEVRQRITPTLTDELAEDLNHNLAFTGGLSLFIGGGDSDEDDDGVMDDLDACPGTPEDVRVDSRGCPVDSDSDGVANYLDQCANTPAGARVDAAGCPTDGDDDGVLDGIDQCPNTRAGVEVDARGCAIDTDSDGVPNGLDQCPNTQGGAEVDAQGCAVDTDGDGVPNGLDQCPNTPSGTEVAATGCPVPETEVERQLVEEGRVILNNVYFDFNRATLRAESRPALNEVGRALIRNPELRVEIQGHTDAIGTDQYNQGLSQRRAQSVLDYLQANFPELERDQYTVRGYGESQPIATNDTDEGRQRNRRVEFVVLEGPDNVRSERNPPNR